MRLFRTVLLPLLALAVTVLSLVSILRPVPVVQVDMAQVHLEAKQGRYRLIEIDELWQRYQNKEIPMLLVDTRQEWEHRAGHIAGSILFSMEPTLWARWFRRSELKTALGPDQDKTVVFY